MATKQKEIRVVYFQRKSRKASNFSVEIYFENIRNSLPRPFLPSVVTMPFESSGFLKRLANAFYCIFKQGDINHITGDIHYVGIFLKKKKTVLTVLDCGVLKKATGLKYQLLKLIWYTLPAKRASYISVISDATKSDLLHYIDYPKEKIKVIYVCISDAFCRAPGKFKDAKPVILQIGTAENKNLRRLIPAIAPIRCKLVIIGKISEEILSLLSEHKIDYSNFQGITEEEIIEHYRNADIISFVSTLEGFGMPIVEANTVGRCVVTGNVSSMPEIAGSAAHILNPFSIEEIRAGILKVINDREYRESLIEIGYENSKRFSKATIVSQFINLYSTMAAGVKSNFVYEQQL